MESCSSPPRATAPSFWTSNAWPPGNPTPYWVRSATARTPRAFTPTSRRATKLLFVSEERARSITVIDLARARSNGYKADAIVGKIPVANAPIALTFSPDGKWLYTTSQGAMPDWHWPKACKPEGRDPSTAETTNPARAASDPAQAVVARVPAGCSPVRMAITPDGARIYVTARNSNAVLAFDAAKLLSDPEHEIGERRVGKE